MAVTDAGSNDELESIRSHHAPAGPGSLHEAGAAVVVSNAAPVQLALETPSAWSLAFDGFDQANEGIREALCILGNGYFATRGAAPGTVADGVHYPGTYLAGGYNRLKTDIAGQVVGNEDLASVPNWLALDSRIADENRLTAQTAKILPYHQDIDLRRGMLLRTIRFEDRKGRCSLVREQRLVSMADMHLGAMELGFTAANWSGPVTVRSAIDGRVVNSGAKLYQKCHGRQRGPGASCLDGDRGKRRGFAAGSAISLSVAGRMCEFASGDAQLFPLNDRAIVKTE